MGKRNESIFCRWSIFAILGFVMSFFSFAPCTGMMASVICAVSMFDCRKNAKRGFVLAVAGLILALIQTVSVLLIMVRNNLWTNVYFEVGAAGAALIYFGIVIACMALFDRKAKKMRSQEVSAQAADQPVTKSIDPCVPGEEKQSPVIRMTIRPEEEKSIIFSGFEIKPLEMLLEEKPPVDIPWDLCIARWMAQQMEKQGFTMVHTSIGGGSDEVSHTGAVAYGGYYRSSEGFIEHCYEHYRKAASEAAAEYGSWFTGLNYHYINMAWDKEGVHIEAKLTSVVTFLWDGGEEGERIARSLEKKMKK